MIKLVDYKDRTEYVHPDNIARVTVADTSSQWHGIRSIVRLFDGSVIECNYDAAHINSLIEDAKTTGANHE